jgi:hypothetical protein
LVMDIRTKLPAVPDVVELPVVAVERHVRELSELRKVAAVLLVLEHVRDAAEVVRCVRRRRRRARHDEFKAKRLVREVDRAAQSGLVAGCLQEIQDPLGVDVPGLRA